MTQIVPLARVPLEKACSKVLCSHIESATLRIAALSGQSSRRDLFPRDVSDRTPKLRSHMGAVYQEFERELESWNRKYAGQPRAEIIRLFLLALEREQIVSVQYSEDVICRRLATLPVSSEVRDIFQHALLWAWKDEEMHAIYVRGAIFKFRSSLLKVLAFARQMVGATGGWAASVRQHVRWTEAPLSRSVASLLTWAGYIGGQVPKDVRSQLDYCSFRDFCLYNVDAERTAWLCFGRLVELLSREAGVTPEVVDDFRRMQDDEDRHRRVFQILADALRDDDTLAEAATMESLACEIRSVEEVFLPRRLRTESIAESPVGSGGRVWVVRGSEAEEKNVLFKRLLDESGLKLKLAERARALGKSTGELRVAVKSTFMLGYHRKDPSSITDPTLLDELGRYLKDAGCGDVAVVEARNIYDHFYSNRTVRDVAGYFNIKSEFFRIVDVSEEQSPCAYSRGLGQYTASRTWKQADFRISFGKLRSHPVELVHLTLGNLEGLGARCDQFFFAERQAQRDTATMMLLDECPPHFGLIDGYDYAPDGLMGIIGCPRPKSPMRLYAGHDVIAVDLVAARHLGLSDPKQSGTLREACHWFGDPSEQIEVIGINEAVPGWRGPYHNEWSTLLSLLAYPVYEFASDRGAVFVPEMDEEAFPPITPENPLLRLRRRSLQAFLGLRHPQ